MTDIVDKLEDRAISYEASGPSAHHTAALLREAKFEIETLRSELQQAKGQVIEQCAKVAEDSARQLEWPRLKQDGCRRSPTARMQEAIAAAIRSLSVASTKLQPTTERADG